MRSALKWTTLKSISGQVVVVCFDISSSSSMVEELTAHGRMDKYIQFLGLLKHHLVAAQQKVMFQHYTFTGDGWILLFPLKQFNNGSAAISGNLLLEFLIDLCAFFKVEFERTLLPHLNNPPSSSGLTFGIAMGELSQTDILRKREYLGLPIIIACRLQGKAPAYTALATEEVFKQYLSSAPVVESFPIEEGLRNIQGGKAFPCKKIALV
jgi:hypothetical protein